MRPLPPTPCAARPGKGTGQTERASQKKGATIKPLGHAAMIVRAPRNCQSGPGCGCGGGWPSQEGTNHTSLPMAAKNAPEKTTGEHIASHQWIPKASRQQAAPGDQRGGPAAAHIGLQGNVENPEETGQESPQTKNSMKGQIRRNSGRGARQRTKPPPKPQKQKLPDGKPLGDRPGPGAGSAGRALRCPPAPQDTKR